MQVAHFVIHDITIKTNDKPFKVKKHIVGGLVPVLERDTEKEQDVTKYRQKTVVEVMEELQNFYGKMGGFVLEVGSLSAIDDMGTSLKKDDAEVSPDTEVAANDVVDASVTAS